MATKNTRGKAIMSIFKNSKQMAIKLLKRHVLWDTGITFKRQVLWDGGSTIFFFINLIKLKRKFEQYKSQMTYSFKGGSILLK